MSNTLECLDVLQQFVGLRRREREIYLVLLTAGSGSLRVVAFEILVCRLQVSKKELEKQRFSVQLTAGGVIS